MNVLAAADVPTPSIAYDAISVELILIGTALALLVWIAIRRPASIVGPAILSGLGAAAATAAAVWLFRDVDDANPRLVFEGMLAIDGFGTLLTILVGVATVGAVALATQYLIHEGADRAEYFVMLLLSAAGMTAMVRANNLVMLFVALETLSVCLYVLSAWHRDRSKSQESGMKYLLLGAYSSAFLVFGMAFLYGASGTVNLVGIREAVFNLSSDPGMFLLGTVLVIVGLGFKVAAVPFHMWAPDVYEGAPIPVVAFMAAGAKIAGFAGLWRLLEVALGGMRLDWQPVIWALAALSMIGGSALAIVQTDIKRAMAYSSVSHAGFIATGLVAANPEGTSGAVFYLAAYTFMVLGAFAIILTVARRGERHTSLHDYKGLARRKPVLAGLLAFFLFAMAGIPGTSGFVAKFSVFSGLAAAEQWALIVVGVLAYVIGVFFYLRVILTMFTSDEDADETSSIRPDWAPGVVMAIAAGVTLLWGVLPQGLLGLTDRAFLIAG